MSGGWLVFWLWMAVNAGFVLGCLWASRSGFGRRT